MWNIGYPDKVSLDEYNSYDHVFMTSDVATRALERRLRISVSTLPPCTDPSLFNPDVPALGEPAQALFVGDFCASAHVLVNNVLQAGLSLEIHGKRWECFVTDAAIRSDPIPDHLLASHYKSAEIILIDPENDPQNAVSDQILDALACGARIALHDGRDLPKRFKGAIRACADQEGLKDAIKAFGAETEQDMQKRRDVARMIVRDHSFAPRIQTILSVVEYLRTEKLAAQGTYLRPS
jgi:O-antigen biosynthesis protein